MKNKTKNIILGVSLGINILLALLVGGALIKSCNDAPTQTATIRRLGTGGGGDEYSVGAVWVFNPTINYFDGSTYSFNFTSNNNSYTRLFFNNGTKSLGYRLQGTSTYTYVYFNSSQTWQDEGYRTITLFGNVTDSNVKTMLSTYAVYQEPASSSEQSSEQTSQSTSEVVSSSEETTEDLTSEQTSAATSEGQPVDSLPSGFTLRFGENNPFSAWAINPYNEDPAIYYDSTAPFVLYTGTASSETSTLVTAKYTLYEVGDFYVAGNPDAVYDTIALTTLNLSTDNYFVPNGSDEGVRISEEAYAKGAFIVAYAYYLNSVTNDRVRVYAMGETSVQVGNNTIMALAGPAWSNIGFRDIVYIGDNPQIEINGYTARASWWLENNALSSSAAVGSMLLGDATNGVFGLIGQAFSSVASIFGIALIPGLTIGTLLFIPLVVLIILAILRLLAK